MKKVTKSTKIKRVLAIAVAAVVVSVATLVYADRIDVAGGTWVYGYNHPINAYSEYYHSYNYHGAKVVNRNNGATGVGNNIPGVWARASIFTVWEPATFYYNSTGYYS